MAKLPIYTVLFTVLISGCLPSVDKEVVSLAEINGSVLTLDEALDSISDEELKADSIQAVLNYRDRWINTQLVLQEAERLDLEDDPEIRKKLDRAIENTLIIAFQEAILSSAELNTEVTDQEARDYYQRNRSKFLLDERYIRFRHMITDNLSAAQNAKRDIMRGIDWETVAIDYSVNPTLTLSNSSKFWPESSALKEYSVLNRYLQLIGESEISIIENINGQYHFVQLVEQKSEGEHPDLDWLLAQIKEWLILEKKRSAYNRYVKNLYLAAQANNEIQLLDVSQDKDTLSSVFPSDTLNSN